MPARLPAEKTAAILRQSAIADIDKEILELKRRYDSQTKLTQLQAQRKSLYKNLNAKALKEYQDLWMTSRREAHISGTNLDLAEAQDDLLKILSIVYPERGRLTNAMTSQKTVSNSQRKNMMQDLYNFITRDYLLAYLPGELPIDQHCPVSGCN